ncbi:hypothetical protein [Rhodoferax sp. GW822-FHT02A01]|uniref:hypothetical protein n=1 Tax=Rhodoferax sp. GW822-FHT02A01 TaxID=3141537 RepID=UPI00315D6A29
MVQSLIAGLLVGASAIYALWTLCPKAARGRLTASLLKLPHPRFLEKPLLQAVKQQGGCGCDGCDRVSLKAPAKPQEGYASIVIHRR